MKTCTVIHKKITMLNSDKQIFMLIESDCICLNLTQGDGSQNLFLNVFAKLSSHIRCNESWSHSVHLSMKKPYTILIPLTSINLTVSSLHSYSCGQQTHINVPA